MSLYKELSYDHDFDVVKGIQFCIMSPDEIKARSVAEITKSETFNGNEPVYHGLFDPRMGVIEHNKTCVTCSQKNTFCPGHFGHINLAKPLFFVQFFDIVKKLLNCVCFRCSKLLIDPNDPEVKELLSKKVSRQKRWEVLYKLSSKVKRCGQSRIDGCGAKKPQVTKEGMLKLALEWKDNKDGKDGDNEGNNVKRQILRAEDVLQIFRRITDSDAELLGFDPKFNRPEWMICTTLPVPPPAVRPSVRTDTGQRQEDDLTHKLLMIVKVNKNLQQKLDKLDKAVDKASEEQIDMWTMLLQYEIATMIDNTHPSIPTAQQKTGRPIRSLTERLKSKEGRIRGNLMGKRVDFSARSVITPDPNLSIDELGVPLKIASNLTFPEIVNEFNIEEMYKLVRNGPDVYPGAKHLRKANTGVTKRLKNIDRSTIVLEHGDIVERHLRNGDIVLFNRQPSLHRMSMQAFRVRVMPYNTFRLNVCVTPSFNADFDGDEMNAHIAQSMQTMEELRQLAAVPTQIITPRESKPIISIVQDICTGVYRITKKNVWINERQMMNLFASNTKFNGVIPRPIKSEGNVPYWQGCQILSSALPSCVNLEMKLDQYDENKSKEENEDYVISIKNGEILSGTCPKDVYQARTRGIVHQVVNECGPDEARLLYDHTQKIVCDWLVYNGFSVGISDLIIDDNTVKSFKKDIRDMKVQVYDIIKTIHDGKFENASTKNNHDLFEMKVNDLLNTAIKNVGEKGTADIRDDTNRLLNMIKSKSKGQPLNVAQMIGCVGQQNIDGRRIPYGFDDRTLPHYTKYDDGPESRGFVQNSFIKGLTPQEFFFHSMGGREGLIDTAVQTSETGYIQRKLVKAMEDCKVNYDMSVRNAGGVVIQYLYGEDGIDATKLESQNIPYIDMDFSKIKMIYGLVKGIEDFKGFVSSDIYEALTKDKVKFEKRYEEHHRDVLSDREHVIVKMFSGRFESTVLYPVSLHRILTNVQNTYNKYGCDIPHDLDPKYVMDCLENLCNDLVITKSCPGNKLFQILLRAYLTPKRIIFNHKLSKTAFDVVVQQIKYKFYESHVHPSEMVGVIAAQSLGEPSTQLVLNTFHSAGISAASKAVRGVPRLNELLAVTKNIKTPYMMVYLKPTIKTIKNEAMKVMNQVRTIRFKDIVKESKIYFDPSDFPSIIREDNAFLNLYGTFLAETQETAQHPWLLRLEFDEYKLNELELDMITLYHTLDSFYGDTITCRFTDDNYKQLIMRIRLNIETELDDDILTDLKALEYNILENVVIMGVKNIEKVALEEKKQCAYDQNTGTFANTTEWVVVTEGTNLLDVLAHPMVDPYKSITNDVNEIYETLGIEAARQALYNEIVEVLHTIEVNYRHIALLVDVMTNKGNIVSVNRHGINRGDIGPLAKCSFEETTDKLIKAGIFAEYDKINGVSANVMLGQVAPCGTGDVNIIMDEVLLQKMAEKPFHNVVSNIESEVVEECIPEAFNIDLPSITPSSDIAEKDDNDFVIMD